MAVAVVAGRNGHAEQIALTCVAAELHQPIQDLRGLDVLRRGVQPERAAHADDRFDDPRLFGLVEHFRDERAIDLDECRDRVRANGRDPNSGCRNRRAPRGHLGDIARVLGDGDESLGDEHTPYRVLPACENLESDRLRCREVDERLIVGNDLTSLDRALDLSFDVATPTLTPT